MLKRMLPCVALLGLVALPTTARPADDKKPVTPALVVREEQAKQFEGMIRAKAGGPKGLEGIDARRPMALYAAFGEGGIENSTAVALIPIADEKAFLGLIENLGAKAEKENDGAYKV